MFIKLEYIEKILTYKFKDVAKPAYEMGEEAFAAQGNLESLPLEVPVKQMCLKAYNSNDESLRWFF